LLSAANSFVPRLPAGDAAAQVIGVLLNQQSAWDAYAPKMQTDPHKQPPQAPVLYLKPANTWARSGAVLEVPAGASGLVAGVTIGAVIGRTAMAVSVSSALEHIAGYTLVLDASLPQPSLYRPPLKYNCRDNYCPMGPQIVPCSQVPDIGQLTVHTLVDGNLVHSTDFKALRRNLPQLVAEISEFMSLQVEDIILLGIAEGAPLVSPGQTVVVKANNPAFGQLHCTVAQEASA
jgi:5-oxopent-3-ene-1,2,5-tricarboxylate decarboxylase / 2-hydroxyhepta-2,4-diene-1,7-dioate isomerase